MAVAYQWDEYPIHIGGSIWDFRHGRVIYPTGKTIGYRIGFWRIDLMVTWTTREA